MMDEIKVHAFWDEEAQMWVATSEQVSGLVTETETAEELLERLRIMIAELLDLNERPHRFARLLSAQTFKNQDTFTGLAWFPFLKVALEEGAYTSGS